MRETSNSDVGQMSRQCVKPKNTRDGPFSSAACVTVLPRRWVVERTFASLGRCRRLAKDWEKIIDSATRADKHRIHPHDHTAYREAFMPLTHL